MKSVSLIVCFLLSSLAAFGQESSELSFPPNGDNEGSEVSQWIGPGAPAFAVFEKLGTSGHDYIHD